MILLSPFLAVISIGIPLFILYWVTRMFVLIVRWLLLLNKNHISPMGRVSNVYVMNMEQRAFRADMSGHQTHYGPSSLDPPTHHGF